MRQISLLCAALCVVCSGLSSSGQERKPATDAAYPLTSKCGPWMVMVKSFQGPEAIEFANKLARELRDKHRIAAYTFVKQPEGQPQIQQVGMVRGRVRQTTSAAVMAGDCKDEKAAAKLQDKIQKLRPECITQDMVPPWQWEAGPLRTAFCLPNPLVPAEPTKPDPILAKLNSGTHSIYRCNGPYTLQVIAFTGAVAYTRQQEKEMEKSNMLALAGERAETTAEQLRKMGYDAYTYHGLNFSLVTIGSFAAANAPEIERVRREIAGRKVGSFMMSSSPTVIHVPRN